MADKKEEDDDKKKGDEDELQAVTDDPEFASAEEHENDDDDREGDERLGASDEETLDDDREAIRERRREEKKTRAQRRKQREQERIELQRENQFFRIRNDRLEKQSVEMARRLDTLEGATIDGRIAQFKAAIDEADETIADAITRQDGDAHKEASQIRDDLREQLRGLENLKEQQASRNEKDDAPDPTLVANARAWRERNSWFDFRRGDDDSAIAGALDDRLFKEGRLDPSTQEYWEELDRRIAKHLPHRAIKKSRKNGRERDDGNEEDEEEEESTQRRVASRKANGGPRFRKGGGRNIGRNEVYLSKDRLDAMKEAGIAPGSPEYKRMLKRYKDFDEQASQAR